MTATSDARAAIDALQGHEAWAIIRRSTRAGDRDTVGLVGGRRTRGRVDPRHTSRGGRAAGRPHRRPAAGDPVPAGQRARLRGARRRHAAGRRRRRDRARVLRRRGDRRDRRHRHRVHPTAAASRPTTRTYAKLVEAIITDEIGQGEGANLVVGRHYRATVADWGVDKALTVFKRLLERERGAYWTYVFFTGDRYLIGASPERHVSIHGGDVRMNPISGTFRIPREGDVRAQLLDFLDGREGDLRALHGRRRRAQDDVRHLQRGRPGARAVPQADDPPRAHRVPPRRAHVARPPRGAARHHVRRHRDRLAGRERLPADQEVRVGGPRLLRRRAGDPRPRPGGWAGRRQPDRDPHPPTSSLDGRLKVTAGATLVRDSDPAYEVAETHAKAGGILSAFGLVPPAPRPSINMAELVNDEDVLLSLNARNHRLSAVLAGRPGRRRARSAAGRQERW